MVRDSSVSALQRQIKRKTHLKSGTRVITQEQQQGKVKDSVSSNAKVVRDTGAGAGETVQWVKTLAPQH